MDKYFVSESAKYIFALLETDCDTRSKLLGITVDLYRDKVKADAWYRDILAGLGDDVSYEVLEARQELTGIYNRMIRS